MVPGFTALSHGPGASLASASMLHPRAYPRQTSRPRAADTWTKSGEGGREEPGGPVKCWWEYTCVGVVRMCHSWCDNGEDSGWYACGGCIGVGGISIDLW